MLAGDAVLYEFLDGAWKERGRGELRINTPRGAAPAAAGSSAGGDKPGAARLLMRQRGNLRLILNATLYPSMAPSPMLGGKGITLACVNHAAAPFEPGAAAAAGGKPAAAAADAPASAAAAEAGGAAAEEAGKPAAAAAEGGRAADAAAAAGAAAAKLATYAVKFRSQQLAEEFKAVVERYKGDK